MPTVDAVDNRDCKISFALLFQLANVQDILLGQHRESIPGSLCIRKLTTFLGTTAVMFITLNGTKLKAAVEATAVTFAKCFAVVSAGNTCVPAVA
jgi:hypothetical protein